MFHYSALRASNCPTYTSFSMLQLFMCSVRVYVYSRAFECTSDTFLHSVQHGGRVEIIANDQGHRITPSWVAFTDGGATVSSLHVFSPLPLRLLRS